MGDASARVPVVDLMGLPFVQLDRTAVVDRVFEELSRGRGGWIATLNLDYVRRCTTEPEVRALLSGADLIVADGMPLLWAARLQGTPLVDRVAGSDLVWLLAERAAREGRSLFMLGGNPGAGEGARQRLLARWPDLEIAGVESPRVSAQPGAEELAGIRRMLEQVRPDVVYVAFGAPKEERLIAALHDAFPRVWFIGVGVSLSFMSGEIRRAPRWMQRTGLEWVHRLVQEPGRLARRYLVEDLPFAARLLGHAFFVGRRRARVPERSA